MQWTVTISVDRDTQDIVFGTVEEVFGGGLCLAIVTEGDEVFLKTCQLSQLRYTLSSLL